MNDSFTLFLKWFGVVMAVLYIVLGIWLIRFSQDFFAISWSARLGFGSLSIIYGLFRIYTIYNRHFKS